MEWEASTCLENRTVAWFEENARTFAQREFQAHEEVYGPLASGQTPKALVITCADSRIETRKLLQAAPGEILELRNAGNVVPPDAHRGEAATVELAVNLLQVQDIILIGHTYCGIAITMQNPPEGMENLPSISNWMAQWNKARDKVNALDPPPTGDEWVNQVVQENVALQLSHVAHIPQVKEAVEAGRLNLHGWVYHIESGMVSKLDPQTGQFNPL